MFARLAQLQARKVAVSQPRRAMSAHHTPAHNPESGRNLIFLQREYITHPAWLVIAPAASVYYYNAYYAHTNDHQDDAVLKATTYQ